MPDYKALYFSLMGEVETTIRKLIEAQQNCEEQLLSQDDDPQNNP